MPKYIHVESFHTDDEIKRRTVSSNEEPSSMDDEERKRHCERFDLFSLASQNPVGDIFSQLFKGVAYNLRCDTTVWWTPKHCQHRSPLFASALARTNDSPYREELFSVDRRITQP